MLKVFKISLLLVFFVQFSIGQNNTNSPYTRYGYGELVDVNSAEQRAMGGVAFGSRDKLMINPANPASYSAVDSTSFMFDVGFTGLLSMFSSGDNQTTGFTSNLEYINLQFPITKWMGFSAGMLPYAFSGYNYHNVDSVAVEGHGSSSEYVNYTSQYFGNGAITQLYAGLGMQFFNHIAIGVNAYYMMGGSSNNSSVIFADTDMSSPSSLQENKIAVSSLRFRYGLQYFHTFKKDHALTIGAIYEHPSPFKGDFKQYHFGIPADTISYNYGFGLPMTFGGGVNYIFKDKLTLSADYMMQAWSDALFFGKTDSLQNRHKIAAGAEYIINPRGNKYVDRMRYRAGFNIHNPYFRLDGVTPPKSFGVSLGLGLPLRTTNTMINASLEYGKVGDKNLLRQDYFKITFNAVFNENWFFKRKL